MAIPSPPPPALLALKPDAPGGDWGFPWAPRQGDTQSIDDASFQHDQSQVTLPIQIYFGGPAMKYRLCLMQILGKAERIGDKLSRTLPVRHPAYPWLYAKRISDIHHLGYVGRTQLEIEGQQGGSYPIYKRTNLTIHFGTLPYDIRTDQQLAAFGNSLSSFEWMRWVEKRSKPLTEFLTSDRGDYKISDSRATIANLDGTTIKQGMTLHVTKRLIEWRWYYVPEAYIYERNKSLTPNIDRCVGRVNKFTFAGFPAGTLLLEAPEIQPAEQFSPRLTTLGNNDEVDAQDAATGKIFKMRRALRPHQVPRVYNVTLPFKFFDPPTKTMTTAIANSDTAYQYRGWNVVPSMKDPEGNHYRMVSNLGAKPLYQGAVFQDIFGPVKFPDSVLRPGDGGNET